MTATTKLSLANLVIDAKNTKLDVPLCPGMQVTLAYANKTLLNNIRNACLVQKFDPDSGATFKELDAVKYTEMYVKDVLKGWTGFTYGHLASLVLIDESAVDLTEEIPFDVETAIFLMKNASAFDLWVVTAAKQLANFRTAK
jgi:hypothetical protein